MKLQKITQIIITRNRKSFRFLYLCLNFCNVVNILEIIVETMKETSLYDIVLYNEQAFVLALL